MIKILCLILLLFQSASNALTAEERAEAYYKQGYIYYVSHSYREAIAEYNKALSITPTMAKSYYWLAKSYYKLKKFPQASSSLKKALKINPEYSEVLYLQKVVSKALSPRIIPKKVETIALPRKPVASYSRRISMDLRNVDITHALRLLAKETGWNIVAGRDVYGKITLSLSDVTSEEAFNAILKAGNLKYTVEGNIIRVTGTGQIPMIQELPGGIIVRTFTINYVTADDLKETLSKLVPDVKIQTTKGSKSIVVEGFQQDITKIENLINSIDIPPQQVMVEAKIIEVTYNNTGALGVNLKYTNPSNPSEVLETKGLGFPSSVTGAQGLYYSVTNDNIEVIADTLQTRTGYNLLSSPKVVAVNDEKAEIITGSRLGYKVKTYTTTGMIESVEFMDIGTKLVITPSIKTDGYMLMEIHPEISEGSIVGDLPQKKSTETTTKLLVRDGQTIIIGGLMKDTSQKVNRGVPFISDIPIVGVPFRRVEIQDEKKEIIILISPHLISAKAIEEMKKPIEELDRKRREGTPQTPLDLFK